jgi:hypothetical protein
VRLAVDRAVGAPDGDRPPLRRPHDDAAGDGLAPERGARYTLRQSVAAPWVPSGYDRTS